LKPDALAVIDVKPGSPTFSQVVHTVTMPNKGDEFHHFGWNACSSSLSPLTGHAFLERRYLIIPGLRSSRIYIVDTKPDPTKAKIHKIIEPEEVFKKTGYSRPHTVHCGPEGIYVSTLGGGGKDGTDGPPGVFIMDCETFDILGRWEIDRGPQKMHYDFWWNLPRDYMVTSEWGLPPQFENGIVPEDLLANKYGHHIHFWDLRARRNVQTIDLGANHQMGLEVRPAHDPVREEEPSPTEVADHVERRCRGLPSAAERVRVPQLSPDETEITKGCGLSSCMRMIFANGKFPQRRAHNPYVV
jgi:selenium-binding protein 1